jgi:hypothetical protein
MGHRHLKTRIAGHQDCGICHPGMKGGKSRERREAKTQIHEDAMAEMDRASDEVEKQMQEALDEERENYKYVRGEE